MIKDILKILRHWYVFVFLAACTLAVWIEYFHGIMPHPTDAIGVTVIFGVSAVSRFTHETRSTEVEE